MPEQLLDALVDVNEDGTPKGLFTCDYVYGDGTQKVKFRNGRGKVPAHSAHLLASHPDITVFGLDTVEPSTEPAFAPEAQPTGAIVGDQGVLNSEDPEALRLRIAELTNQLHAANVKAAKSGQPPEGWTDASAQAQAQLSEEQKAERLAAAKEHLAAEGEEVPDVEVTDGDQKPADPPFVPAGFEETTADGQPRCLAAKGDGSQCANPAVDSGSCGLAKHKDQLTS